MPAKPKALLAWSSGKDSAWSLHVLRQKGEVEVVGLLTTINETFDRVAMHAVRRELVEAQAAAAGLPLWKVPIPWPCPNEVYEQRMAEAVAKARSEGIAQIAFGDLFLEDVRQYRVNKLTGTGVEPIFPVWGLPTDKLAREMIAAGVETVITCVDPKQLDPKFAGRAFDEKLLAELPPSADPCGEKGEFHSFCHAGPMYRARIPIKVGEIVERDGFRFADVLPA
ncbi:MAG: adenine nucleotide alpha hydrolase [Planctomycetes bacterium]|nr:adenine nucleotide alpha hydrolase [Planctomycetota bacterium]